MNVLIVTFDTTRADHISVYNDELDHTPTIEALAAEGTVFEHAVAPVPITLPSHTTLFTGKYPVQHGVRDNGLFRVTDEQTTLAEMLLAEGYATGAAVGSFPVSAHSGINQGFEYFNDDIVRPYQDYMGIRVIEKAGLFFDERPALEVNDSIWNWLDDHADQPFFLWAHYFDPHQPQAPPHPYDQIYADQPYLGEIAYADEALGEIITRLKTLGVYDNTIIVITSDHGEGLNEHRELTHSMLNYETTQHVPLVMRVPGQTPNRVARTVGLVDVVPTLMDFLDIALPVDVDGESLWSWISNGEGPEAPHYYAETLSPRLSNNWGELRTLYETPYKYIHGPRPELYDLATDPNELSDLSLDQPELAEKMKARLGEWIDNHARSEVLMPESADPEVLNRLVALGYVQPGVAPTAIEERLSSDGEAPQDHAHTISLLSKAKAQLAEGHAAAALVIIDRLVANDPQNSGYLSLKVNALMAIGKHEEGLALYDEMVAAPDMGPSRETTAFMGVFLTRIGRVDDAISEMAKYQSELETAEGQYHLATLMQRKGDLETERMMLERALELDQNLYRASVDLAVNAARRGQIDEAVALFEETIEAQPYVAKNHYNYGAFLAKQERYEEALPLLERAVQLNDGYVEAMAALAIALNQTDRPLESAQVISELRSVAPQHPLTLLTIRQIGGQQ